MQLSSPSWSLVLCCLLPATHKGNVEEELFCPSTNHKILLIVPCLNTNTKTWPSMTLTLLLVFFPFLIFSRCCSLHFQHKVNSSTRINRAAVQNAMHSHHTYCIKIHFINLCVGLNISRAHGAIIESVCMATKHGLNVGFAFSLFILFSQSYFLKKRKKKKTKLSFASH